MRTARAPAQRRHGTRSRATVVGLVLAVAMAISAPAIAQDQGAWPSWHGGSDNARQGTVDGPSDPGVKWLIDDREETGDLQGPGAEEGFSLSGPDHPILAPDGTVIVRGANRAVSGAVFNSSVIGIDDEDGSLAWHLPSTHTGCQPAIDSAGHLWVQRMGSSSPEVPFDDRTLQAIDTSTGEPIAGSEFEDVPRCLGTALHIGGADAHIAWMDGGGQQNARILSLYDISSGTAVEAWTIDLGGDSSDWDLIGGNAEPAIVFTDDSLIVAERGLQGGARVVRLVAYPFDDPTEADSIVLPMPGDDVDGDDFDRFSLLTADGAVIVGASRRSLSDAQPYLARVDLSGGMSLTWTRQLDSSGSEMALTDSTVVTQTAPGTMTAHSLSSGEPVWTVPSRGSELITDASGNVYTGTQYNPPDSGGESAVSSYSPQGALRWRAPTSRINEVLGLEGHAESVGNDVDYGPIAADGTLYVVDSGKILAIDNSGGLALDPLAEVPDRVSGSDRFETAADICAEFVAPGPATVYVATGGDFPDALTGGVPAALTPTCMLLTIDDHIPPRTIAELERLAPASITVLGGSGAVPASVVDALGAYTDGPVHRLSGPTRFETSAAISANTFSPADTRIAFVATGLNFPDALAGVPVGAAYEGPILLVTPDFIPPATRAELDRLDLHEIVVLGGSGAVSDTVLAELGGYAAEVRRASGPDRFATSVAVGDLLIGQDPPSPLAAFVATGIQFPDALAGGAVAGAIPGPIYLVAPDFAPPEVTGELGRISPDRLIIFGGTSAVSPATEAELRQAAGLD